jgi:hypothetical protein
VPLYLVWHEPERTIEPELRLALERFELRPGLMLVDSPLTRSKLYHRVKWALPAGTALLVASLTEAPKFKGMETGALTWTRARTG